MKGVKLSANNSEPTPFSSSIEKLLKSLRGGDRLTTVTVFSRWEELVGETVASHVRPLKLDNAILIIEVDEPMWATQMKFLEADVLKRLNEGAVSPIKTLEIRVKKRR